MHHSTIAQQASDAVGVINILPYHQRCRSQQNDHQIRLSQELLMTPRISAPVHAMNAVRHPSQRLLGNQKIQFLPTAPAFFAI